MYAELSKSFATGSGVRQGCPLTSFFFTFVSDAVPERTLEDLLNPGVQTTAGGNLVGLDYADNTVLLFENEEEAQVVLNKLAGIILSLDMCFESSKCKVMLQDVQNLSVPLPIQGETLEVVYHFTYLGSFISTDCSVLSSRCHKLEG